MFEIGANFQCFNGFLVKSINNNVCLFQSENKVGGGGWDSEQNDKGRKNDMNTSSGKMYFHMQSSAIP